MIGDGRIAILLWAAREIGRRPGRALLTGTCLASVVFLLATALLFSQALETTWTRLMDRAPDLVVRRVDGGGWAPLPAQPAVSRARAVPGVVAATPRVWGVVPGPDGPLTVVASPAAVPEGTLDGLVPPDSGQAVVGSGLKRTPVGGRLTLGDRLRITVTVSGTFPDAAGLATHDLVWLNAADARRLLGLSDDQASDLAVRLSRREEERAIQADLAAAFPWPVRITDRSGSALQLRTAAARAGGIALVAGLPALLALLLIIAGVAGTGAGRRPQWGLLRAVGWTSGDLIRLQVAEALITGLPAVAAGLAAAYALVFWPPTAGVAALWITGGERLPALALDSSGALWIMAAVAAAVCLPYLAAVFLTSLRGAAGDPWIMLQADPWN